MDLTIRITKLKKFKIANDKIKVIKMLHANDKLLISKLKIFSSINEIILHLTPNVNTYYVNSRN